MKTPEILDSDIDNKFFGALGNTITFKSEEECVPDAPQIEWRPDNIGFRKSHDLEERFILNLYLWWVFLKKPFQLDYPFRIERRDNEKEPDFFVSEGEKNYGLEITRATTQNLEKALAQLIRLGSAHYLQGGSHLYGEDHKFNPTDYIAQNGCIFNGESILGSEPEMQWANIVKKRIDNKTTRFLNNYQHFQKNCDLLLYSVWGILDLDDAIKRLQSILEVAKPDKGWVFKRIHIVCESWAVFDLLGNEHKSFMANGFIQH